MRRCLKIKVTGKVQGVFYRDFVQKSAQKLGIEGTAQNSEDGTCVIILVCGDLDKLDAFIDDLYKGSPKSKVADVLVEPLQHIKDFRGVFRVIGSTD